MPWKKYTHGNTGQSREVFTTSAGKTYTFTRDKEEGRRLNFDTPIRFETKAEWNSAIDRGLGTHSTSIVTRARAHLGSYISLIEQEYGSIDKATPAQKAKCEAIRETQRMLAELYEEERNVDAANFNNGPDLEQAFKDKIQAKLIRLSTKLEARDRELGSAMRGRAAHVVVDAIDQVGKFNWPFAVDSPDTVEKNTRRRKISIQDQLQFENESGGIYLARQEFPQGLTDVTRDRLMNLLVQTDSSLSTKENESAEFKKGVNNLGQTRNILTNFFIRTPYQVIRGKDKDTIDIKGGFKETPNAKAVSKVHANRIANKQKTPFNTWDDMSQFVKSELTKLQLSSPPPNINLESTEKRLLWNLCVQGNIQVDKLLPIQKLALANLLQPMHQLDDLQHLQKPLPTIIPEGTQGNLFARGGIMGATYHIVDPIFSVIEDMGKKDPIMGSLALAVWGAGIVYVGGVAVAQGAHVWGGQAFSALSQIMDKAPGLRESCHAIYAGIMPITSESSAMHVAFAQFADGFVMGKVAYLAMTGKGVVDKDEHALDYQILNFIANNPIEAAVIAAACICMGHFTVKLMGDAADMGNFTLLDDMTAGLKPGMILADVVLAMRSAAGEFDPEFLDKSTEFKSDLLATQFIGSVSFENMSAKEKTALKEKVKNALKTAEPGKEYEAVDKVLTTDAEKAALTLFLPGQTIRQKGKLNTLLRDSNASILPEREKQFNQVLAEAPAGCEYEALSAAAKLIYSDGPETLKKFQETLDSKFPIQAQRNSDKNIPIQENKNALAALNFDTVPTFKTSDKVALCSLLSKDKKFDSEGLQLSSGDFLRQRYPDCVAAYGKCPDGENPVVWNEGLEKAMRNLFMDDVLLAREQHPRVWTLLKQYPALLKDLTGASVDELTKMPAVPHPPSHWQSSIFPAIARGAHGIGMGATIGLAMYASQTLFGTKFDEDSREWSGFNNLRGVIEGIPYAIGGFIRPFNTMNDMFILSRARILDRASTFPKNYKSIPGWLGNVVLAAATVAIDTVVGVLSFPWNVGAKFGRWLLENKEDKKARLSKGEKEVKPTWKELLYKFPLVGTIAELIGTKTRLATENSFEERAMNRLIASNKNKQMVLGKSRNLAVGRAGDISMYRKSNVEVVLQDPPQGGYPKEKQFNTKELTVMTQVYESNKDTFSQSSHIMKKFIEFAHQKNKQGGINFDFRELLEHTFPEEAEKLRKQYDLAHIREREKLVDEKEKDGYKANCNQAISYTLGQLFQAEIAASKGSKTANLVEAYKLLEPTSPITTPSMVGTHAAATSVGNPAQPPVMPPIVPTKPQTALAAAPLSVPVPSSSKSQTTQPEPKPVQTESRDDTFKNFTTLAAANKEKQENDHRPVIIASRTDNDFSVPDLIEKIRKTGIDITSPSKQKFKFQMDETGPKAVLTADSVKNITGDVEEKYNMKIAATVMNMIDNVLANSDHLHIKTKDPFIAAVANAYIQQLKKNPNFKHITDQIETPDPTKQVSKIESATKLVKEISSGAVQFDKQINVNIRDAAESDIPSPRGP